MFELIENIYLNIYFKITDLIFWFESQDENTKIKIIYSIIFVILIAVLIFTF